MKRNLDAPEQKADSSNHVNGAHIQSYANPLASNTNMYQSMLTDISAFNQHLISNLTTSLFLEQQNVLSKLISDLGLSSSFSNQNFSLLDSELKSCEEKKKNSFSIESIIQKSNDSPPSLSKSNNAKDSSPLISKKSPELVQNMKREDHFSNENVNREFILIESKLRLPLKFGFKRETIVRELTTNGVKGDIIYYSPCGRKLRNFQEIERFLYKYYADQKIKSVNVQLSKENFTFSSKFIVGNYLWIEDSKKVSDLSINHNNIKDFKHLVLNEKDIVSKLTELYPDFKRNLYENFHPNIGENNEEDFRKNNGVINGYKNFSHDFKQKEKYIQREKKARLRWFNYMICKYTDKKTSECSSHEALSRTKHAQIDDMQQKYLTNLPEFGSLNTLFGLENLAWLGNALQTIEFIGNFRTTILNSFATVKLDEHQIDLEIFSSVKNFFLALKNLKYKKELNDLVQILLKILLNDPTADSNEGFEDDQVYLMAHIRSFEMNESTFSEILRLYFVKSLKNLKSHRDNSSFDIDVTSDLVQQLENFVQELELNHFEMLKMQTKASVLAHLTDDLLQNSAFLQNSTTDQESRRPNLISEFIEDIIEKLNKLKQDKIQINHKIRHSSEMDEKMHEKKQIAQREISSLHRQLRSGQFLGQDRYKRLYWKLNSFKPILIESNYQNNLLDRSCLSQDVNYVLSDLVDRVETDLESESIIEKFSHLIELVEEPFSLKIKSDQADFLSLSFSDIEILVKNLFWSSNRTQIPSFYLSREVRSSDKWWIWEKSCSDILSSLSTHGFREKNLAKNLNLVDQCDPDENFGEYMDSNLVKPIRSEKTKVLKQIMSFENKVYNANLQLPQNLQKESNCDSEASDDDQSIILARQRLIKLERSIDKRYLRYPFSSKKKLSNYKLKTSNEADQLLLDKVEQKMNNSKINMSLKLNQDIRAYMKKIDVNRKEDINLNATEELLRWRRLVNNSKSSSQIMLYLHELNKYIEWDKSIMKASCHICGLDNNEENLLLCDNCDLGYHTYCFVPKIERVPDGDWYCFKCISKFLGNKQMCYVCGRDSAVFSENEKQILNKCEKCSCIFHGKCMPNAKFFKTTFKWHCINCLSNKIKNVKSEEAKLDALEKVPKKRGRKRKHPFPENNNYADCLNLKKNKNEPEKGSEVANASAKKMSSFTERLTLKKIKQQKETDLYKCRILLNELIRNKYSNYFMIKVNEKEYPDYYEIIKQPIDLNTIKEKLKSKSYENKEQFAYDCRLIFDNCECFNEDDSQIGQAGHKLRAIFETKWLKLFD